MSVVIIFLVPFLGTVLGAATVFVVKDKLSVGVEKVLLGFASGVMIAAAVWSLLIPSMELARENGQVEWVPAAAGFLLGMLFLKCLDELIPHLHLDGGEQEGLPVKLPKEVMMALAMTLHNIPEGMAVGVAFAGAYSGDGHLTMMGALALSVGIAIQNFPEGAIVSLPLYKEGLGRDKSFGYGVLSGTVEPVFGFVTAIFAEHVLGTLSYLFAFAAGSMMYVVIEELIPESQMGEHSNLGTMGAALGFVLMMVLDCVLA
ncbi:MAG: ZIP family metal transporter [Acidaminococcaceae bacterium]|nr:ZIP family metal transporter [Acidaminococcaceae bacterium]